MEENLFDTQEKIEQALANFLSLREHPGWKLMEEILDKNIQVIREVLEGGTGEGETKADVDRIREKLTFAKWFRNMPKNMIEKLETSNGVEPNVDPFETAEELRSRRLDK